MPARQSAALFSAAASAPSPAQLSSSRVVQQGRLLSSQSKVSATGELFALFKLRDHEELTRFRNSGTLGQGSTCEGYEENDRTAICVEDLRNGKRWATCGLGEFGLFAASRVRSEMRRVSVRDGEYRADPRFCMALHRIRTAV